MNATIDIFNATIDMVGNLIGRSYRLKSDVVRDSRAVARESAALYRAAVGAGRAVVDASRATPRFARIMSEVLWLAGAYRLHAAAARHMPADVAAERLNGVHRNCAERMYRLCIELGGGVLKVGQLLSARMDLLPMSWIEPLARLQDRVPAEPLEDVQHVIEEALGAPVSELFASIERQPLAAASLAQVHAARLHDGTEVVVKVQRPDIDAVVAIDAQALQVAASTLRQLIPKVDVETVVREVCSALVRELDFGAEAIHMTEFAVCFAADDRVIVPRVIPELTARRVLTMTRVEGARLTDWLNDAAQTDRAALDTLLGTMVDLFCAQVLTHGLVHADPHPGNFMVCPGPRLAFLDFGCVQRYTAEQRTAWAQLTSAILSGNAERIATDLETLGFVSNDRAALVEMAGLVLESFREELGGDLSQIDARAQLERFMELVQDSPVVAIPPGFVMLGRVLATLGGLVLHYEPRINLFLLVAPHLSHALTAQAAAA